MPTFTLKTIQRIPTDLENAWSFFSDPANLQAITPPKLGFTILSDPYSEIYPGQIIEYKVRPVLGIPIYWLTEITHVQDKIYFVDEQRFGPYQLWQHQHHFSMIDGGVKMTDIIHYRNPLGFLGNMANRLFVEKQLRRIFEFRFGKIQELFGLWGGGERNSIEFKPISR
jgi:ligand-binding SRPBCC domain-containing protein